ncbi:MAG: methyltransferase [Bacteroidales bacterium]|nr:methyltransferase [Candidatus Sodaliphilus fimicaballi]
MARRKGFFEFKHFTIQQTHAAMKVGTDSDLLGTLSQGGDRTLDVGTGTGVLSLMLAQRYPQARITAVEIDDNAVIDATANFAASPMGERIELLHTSFQDYTKQALASGQGESYDAVVCNPPYFDQSLECPDEGRTRARHSSSLPFDVLAGGAYRLLKHGGVFSVCIPPEVLTKFKGECQLAGFSLQDLYKIKTLPQQEVKRLVLVMKKAASVTPHEHDCVMLNEDGSRSPWYREIMRDFLLNM